MRPAISAVVGRVLEAGVGLLHRVRHPRPVHPRGVVFTAAIEWLPRRSVSGIRWIDEPPPAGQSAVVRFSRSIGLPASLPDVLGLAIRTSTPGEPADILLATTGRGVPSRYLLVPRRNTGGAWFSSILPYRGAHGPVLIAARSLDPDRLPAGTTDLAQAVAAHPWTLQLLHARPGGLWHPFATLTLTRTPVLPLDTGLRFDPILHPLSGATTYPWTRRLREPSYARAQNRAGTRA